jgi:N6-adenosine-specific RNA methylase IME4
LPKLSKEEYEALKESIKTEGQHYPIIINKDGIILDGHHRFQICQELGLTPKYEIKEFPSPLHEKKFVIESNLLRRQLTTFQRIEMGKPLLEIEQELAYQRKLSTLKQGDELPVRQNFAERGKTIELFAEKIGSNPETVRQALWLIGNAPQEELGKLRSGGRAIFNLYKETKHWITIQKLKEQAKTLQAPEGLFDVIVIDPPWNYGTTYDPEGRRVASPYPEMDMEELKALKLPVNENCVLWLWTTNAFMHEAFHLLEAWKFEPKTILTWAKDKMGLGDWLRGQTEHCILAIKGKPIINLTNQTTLLQAKSMGHSRKPQEFYELIDSLCYGRKLDYFGREKREGWDVYGTQEFQTDN